MGRCIAGRVFPVFLLFAISPVQASNAYARSRTASPASPEQARGLATPSINGSCTAIPDDAYDGQLSSMACVSQAGLAQTLQSVKLKLRLQHSFAGDLTVKVVSPSNHAVTVLSRPGFAETADDGSGCCGDSSGLSAAAPLLFDDASSGASAEMLGANLSDAQVVCRDDEQCSFVPAAGAAAPGTFADFLGVDGTGTWQVCAGDSENLETGALCSATLVFNDLEADLALAASFPDGVSSDAPFALRLSVTNNGPSPQSGTMVAAALPSGVAYLADDCGAQVNGSWLWNAGTLAVGATATCTVQLQVAPANACPQVAITAAASGDLPDATAANNTATAQNGGDNRVRDAGLEVSGPAGGGDWTSTSTNYGHVFCAQGRCTDNPTLKAWDGEWWAWFGGVDPAATGGAVLPEIGTLRQTLVIPRGANTLAFQTRFAYCGGVAGDFLSLRIDGSEVWRADATHAALCGGSYTSQSADIAAFADGAAHTVEFHGEENGQGALSTFFVDSVVIVAPVTCTGDAIFRDGFEG